ncbi:MAG: AAA family ATPase, partial [Prevotellaceae bacterium]|nr:AAA family ATPase [Prevotellaceae bacterium]
MIIRTLESVIKQKLFKGKAIIILGARQVGKTTLLQQINESKETSSLRVLSLNCDEPGDRILLSDANSTDLAMAIKGMNIVIIDEAQRVKNIGITLKLLVDKFKDVQIIATGSSALELANEINEPLTGRKFEYLMFPVSTQEIIDNNGFIEAERMLETRLIYGSYPDILYRKEDVKELLFELTKSYLYKDILSLQELRKPDLLEKLLIALALQIGNTVSFN